MIPLKEYQYKKNRTFLLGFYLLYLITNYISINQMQNFISYLQLLCIYLKPWS
ncbi:MAG: hypothetical protein ACI9WV_001870 [Patiriisocius sp.]|jgi:hypothetical protein